MKQNVINSNNESVNSADNVRQCFINKWSTDPERYWERPDYVTSVAKTTITQLQISCGIIFGLKSIFDVIASWGAFNDDGVFNVRTMLWRGMPAAAFHVQGFQHTGWCIISLNEGTDLYEIELADEDFFAVPGSRTEDVYNHQLGELVDRMVETGNMSKEEYDQKVAEAEPVLAMAARNGVKSVICI